MTAYNPLDSQDRFSLALALGAKMEECGFQEESRVGTKERVYSRSVIGSPGIRVLVYTNPEGVERGIVKAEKRVYRTGEILGIVSRTYQRMREVYGLAMKAAKCSHCGAPLFLSRKGNLVCADA